MLFNSPEFGIFLVCILAAYYISTHRVQNIVLLAGSYIFYGWWDWRFLGLILISTIVDFLIGICIESVSSSRAKFRLIISSLIVNLGILGVFKYYNFFASSLDSLLLDLGFNSDIPYLNVVLPVGISFYTFQTLSYSIDVYRGKIPATRNLLDFALYVTFFPQLVAGPIERASHLLPAIASKRIITADQISRGGWLIYWGLFKKVVIADNLALVVNPIFDDLEGASALQITIATYLFAWQIYCDFSGYTDIARGCSSLMGIDLCLNFNLPYFATNPSDFWQRWHISLSTWLRDYLYIPLGGNRLGIKKMYRNLMITMLLGGLWHGASWNFVLWGLFHGVLLVLFRRFDFMGTLKFPKWLSIVLFFHITCVGWLLFRVQDLSALTTLWQSSQFWDLTAPGGLWRAVFVLPLIALQIAQYRTSDLFVIFRLPWMMLSIIFVGMYWMLFGFGQWGTNEFIYFQF
ncbi:MAG: membrane-bound O-acyltransferase family protein [Blastopirellula sp.]|nr:MAG: membrane-bound O-acyltransferase family protein [Blastopirellula sp.]